MRSIIRRFRGLVRARGRDRVNHRRTIRSMLADLRPVFGAADIWPKFSPSQFKTYTASAAVVGGRLVASTGARTVGPAAARSVTVVGVAHRDAAIDEQVAVGRLATYLLRTVGAVNAGVRVVAAADGRVQAYDPATMDAQEIVGYNAGGNQADATDAEINLTI